MFRESIRFLTDTLLESPKRIVYVFMMEITTVNGTLRQCNVTLIAVTEDRESEREFQKDRTLSKGHFTVPSLSFLSSLEIIIAKQYRRTRSITTFY